MTRLWLFLADLIVPRPPSRLGARMNPAKQNPPITAAGLAAAVNGLIVAFGHFTDEQSAAIGGGDPRARRGSRSGSRRPPDQPNALGGPSFGAARRVHPPASGSPLPGHNPNERQALAPTHRNTHPHPHRTAATAYLHR